MKRNLHPSHSRVISVLRYVLKTQLNTVHQDYVLFGPFDYIIWNFYLGL